MKAATIGLVLPSSSIMPMSRHFEEGIKRGFSQLTNEGWDIRIVTQFVGQGSGKRIGEAVNTLSGHYDADIITGIVSNRVANTMGEQFVKSKKPFLINNIGEHLPDPRSFNDFLFLHSSHTWKQVWSLGNWGVKQFGRRGMFVGGLYDTGYSFMQMMKLGMLAADTQCELPFSVAPLEAGGKTADPKVVFPHIEQYKPDFLLGVFCGEEASGFLEEYVASGLHKRIPLLSLPFLLESFDAKGEELEVYTTTVAGRDLPLGDMNGSGKKLAEPFSDLGFESGLFISEALRQSEGKNVHETMRHLRLYGEDGILQVSADETGNSRKVFLVKNKYSGNKERIRRSVLHELPSIEINDPDVTGSLNEASSGWENPYLGV